MSRRSASPPMDTVETVMRSRAMRVTCSTRSAFSVSPSDSTSTCLMAASSAARARWPSTMALRRSVPPSEVSAATSSAMLSPPPACRNGTTHSQLESNARMPTSSVGLSSSADAMVAALAKSSLVVPKGPPPMLPDLSTTKSSATCGSSIRTGGRISTGSVCSSGVR